MKKYAKWIILTSTLFVIYIFYEYWASSELIRINHYQLESEVVHEDLKLIVLSDLHEHEFGTKNQDLVSKISEQNPDLLLLIGDFVNSNSENPDTLIHLIEQLQSIAPVYFAFGNHEISYVERTNFPLKTTLEQAGATVLEKEYVDIQVKNTTIRLGEFYGYAFELYRDDLSQDQLEKKNFLEAFQDTDHFKLMMSHRPDSFIFGDASKIWDIDLVVSGHNHGGQVVVPLLGGLFGGDQGFFPEYIHGMYEKDLLNIFITSGLSTNPKPLPRFNNRPEIAVLTIS